MRVRKERESIKGKRPVIEFKEERSIEICERWGAARESDYRERLGFYTYMV